MSRGFYEAAIVEIQVGLPSPLTGPQLRRLARALEGQGRAGEAKALRDRAAPRVSSPDVDLSFASASGDAEGVVSALNCGARFGADEADCLAMHMRRSYFVVPSTLGGAGDGNFWPGIIRLGVLPRADALDVVRGLRDVQGNSQLLQPNLIRALANEAMHLLVPPEERASFLVDHVHQLGSETVQHLMPAQVQLDDFRHVSPVRLDENVRALLWARTPQAQKQNALARLDFAWFRQPFLGECIEQGVHLDGVNDRGQTALIRAAVSPKGGVFAMRSLLAAGASTNVADQDGMTPLHLTAAHADEEGVAMLLSAGASVHAVDAAGRTPLY